MLDQCISLWIEFKFAILRSMTCQTGISFSAKKLSVLTKDNLPRLGKPYQHDRPKFKYNLGY